MLLCIVGFCLFLHWEATLGASFLFLTYLVEIKGQIMKIDITSRNVTPPKELINFIKEKLQKLLKYDSNITHSKVILLKESRAEKVKIIITTFCS